MTAQQWNGVMPPPLWVYDMIERMLLEHPEEWARRYRGQPHLESLLHWFWCDERFAVHRLTCE